MASARPYTGRFAPSPTGPLHLGSLIGALASYCDARAHGGRWLLRIEDVDTPRVVPGAAQAIITALRAHGLLWDGDVVWQSRRHSAYRRALAQLAGCGHLFYCSCPRKRLRELGGVYPGTCRAVTSPPERGHAVRVRVADKTLRFEDGLQGPVGQQLAEECGDFVVLRRDGIFAYQLAVVVDDAAQGVTDIVRGCDLLPSTARQIYLQQLLGLPTPRYLHFPVIADASGHKLSKQTHAPPLVNSEAAANLRQALAFLRQPTPPEHCREPAAILSWAAQHWSREAIPAVHSIPQ